MKHLLYLFLITFLSLLLVKEIYFALAIAITVIIVLRIITKSNDSFVFREWALLLYSLNYLFSPALTYLIDSEEIIYPMQISSQQYFSLAFPGFILFTLGMLILPTRIFNMDFNEVSKTTLVNERFLVQLTLLGIVFFVSSSFFSSDIAFFIYFKLLKQTF